MSGNNFTELMYLIVTAIIVVLMQMHLVQQHQGFCSIIGNGLCIAIKTMEMYRNMNVI